MFQYKGYIILNLTFSCNPKVPPWKFWRQIRTLLPTYLGELHPQGLVFLCFLTIAHLHNFLRPPYLLVLFPMGQSVVGLFIEKMCFLSIYSNFPFVIYIFGCFPYNTIKNPKTFFVVQHPKRIFIKRPPLLFKIIFNFNIVYY